MLTQDKSVAILLSTYNGASFLQQQLDSFQAQTHKNWVLWVSDDGSTDSTQGIVQGFLQSPGIRGALLPGPQRGFCNNFMSLVCNPHIEADYYAFADQDDIWLNDKLARAVQWLSQIENDKPALYCSRTQLIDSQGREIGLSPLHKKPPAFANALLHNIASGNTMVFNRQAKGLLQQAKGQPMVVHDWSLYQIVSGCGGEVFYDLRPGVLYRQHGNNQIGNGMNPIRRISNFIHVHQGRTALWNDCNYQVLTSVAEHLTPAASQSLQDFRAIRGSNLLKRLQLMHDSGIYHQQPLGSLATLSYILLNKI